MNSRRRTRLRWIIAAMLLTLPAAIVMGTALTDDVVRWFYLRKLSSDDPQAREEGSRYIALHIRDDPALHRWVENMLSRSDDPKRSEEIILGLRRAGLWGPELGPAWVADLSQAAQDESSTQRLRALRGAAITPEPHRSRLIHAMLNDPHPEVARHAWILAGLLANDPGAPALPRLPAPQQLRDWPMESMQAVLWASSQSTSDRGSTASILWFDRADLNEPWLPAAVYAMSAAAGDWWRQPLTQAARGVTPQVSDPGGLAAWRAILSMELSNYLRRVLLEYREEAEIMGPMSDELAAAAVTRVADELPPPVWSGRAGYELRELAHFESVAPESVELIASGDWPPLVRALAIRAAAEVDEATALAGLDVREPAAGRLAAMYLADRLDAEVLTALAEQAINDPSDDVRMNAAMMIGYTGLDPALLHDRLEREAVWLVRQHLLLGLLMLGEAPADFDAMALLMRDDVPRLTVLWALLHAGRIEALDELLSEDADIVEALDHQRFRPMLQRYLPATPPFWLYADVDLQRFQADVIRDWYLLNRLSLTFDPVSKHFVTPARDEN